MGQKVNPNILRLGINKPWRTQFFEKTNQELPTYTFKDLEIKVYLERFLDLHGILLHDYRQQFNNANITCYISYFVTPQFLSKSQNADKKFKKILVQNSNGDKKTIIKSSSKKINQIKHIKNFKSDSFLLYKNNKSSLMFKNYLQNNKTKTHDLKSIKANNPKNGTSMAVKGLFSQVFRVINLFTSNQYNVIFNFLCVNKELKFNQLQLNTNKDLVLLKKFRNTTFFKEGIELLFHVISTINSSKLLAKFIAMQIKTAKRQNFFFTFLKKTLLILLNSDASKISGIKIIVKGRINGAAKARHKTIVIGRLPLQTLNANIDYSQTYVHNSNGTYGIKVWTAQKKN
jgi:small subunit ribosomal protein S3